VFGLSFYIRQSILQPCLGSSVRLLLAFRACVLGFEVEALDFRFVVVTLLGLLLLLSSFSEISPELQLPLFSVSASSLSISSSLLQSTSSSSL